MKQDLSLNIGDIVISRIGNDCTEKTTKFLGMHLDENLSWKYHINDVNKKVSMALFSIKQVKQILPFHCLERFIMPFSTPFVLWNNSLG